MKKRKLLGQVLLEQGYIDKNQLDKAIEFQKKEGIRLGEALLRLNYIDQDIFSKVLAEQLGLPTVDLNEEKPTKEAMQLIEEKFMRDNFLIPLKIKNSRILVVAMADPLNVYAIDEISRKTGLNVESVVSNKRQIEAVLNAQFGELKTVDAMLEDIEKSDKRLQDVEFQETLYETEEDLTAMEQMAGKAPIIKLVNSIILDAIKLKASDIHIEPEEDRVRVRNRIDGVLQEGSHLPISTKLAVISRIKIMAGLDIAERRIPQDGRITVKVEGRDVDMRCSSLPILHGEKIVLRVIDPQAVLVELDKLGMSLGILEKFKKLIKKPHGIMLVTGPTGSGKTSTLYAALREINTAEDNIVTIEDPVEYPIRGINQVQINPKAGLNFSSGLRSFLRQDPDKIMVGEIRDLETAEIAIHAALTGHLVFSTLHTNDAPGVVIRLTNMGVEPFLVCSGVIGAVAQRLVRKICLECKKETQVPKEVLENFDISDIHKVKFYKGEGCLNCRGTGYQGRIGIFEIFTLNEPVKRAILSNKSSEELRQIATETNALTSLREDGYIKAKEGITTLEEILRVTQEEEYETE